VDERDLLPLPVRAANTPTITELAGLEEVRTLTSSRFGAVRLVRRPNGAEFEYFAAKYYNAGENREGSRSFPELVRRFVSLSHPSVMPVVGLIRPTMTTGPIVLTPYSEIGSLADVLERVRRNDPPVIWDDAGKLRMIVSLISGFAYLHRQGVVHREVKPSDLIVQPDGSIRICGYLTSVLEEHKFTRESQVGAPSYRAPEIYEGDQQSRDPKTDVFSFGLILYEILCTQRVFPPTSSPAVIMRRAMSEKEADRPVIPRGVHPVLRELIATSWVPTASTRQSFEVMGNRLREVQFAVFPAASFSV
jgi:serine/threonine-protein kinase